MEWEVLSLVACARAESTVQNDMGQWDEAIWMGDMGVESNDYVCGGAAGQ